MIYDNKLNFDTTDPDIFYPRVFLSLSTRSGFKSNSLVHTHPMVSGFTKVTKDYLDYKVTKVKITKVIGGIVIPVKSYVAVVTTF